MKKIFALLLALSLLLSAAALAEHAEEESAPLTREELEIYLQSLSREALADETLSVSVQEDGTVYVNDRELNEPYVSEKALGNCNIEFPYQVPENQWFVMGDHRSTSSDSRNTAVGCVSVDRVVGVVLFRVWPFEQLGRLN